MDIFYEQFITKDYKNQNKIFNSIKQALIVLAVFNIILNIKTLVILSLLGYFLVYIICRKKFLEYEYELTGDDLVISKIIDRKSRKKIAQFKLGNIIDAKLIENFNRKDIKVVNATLNGLSKSDLKEVVIITKKDSNLIGYKMTIDEKFQSILKNINPTYIHVK